MPLVFPPNRLPLALILAVSLSGCALWKDFHTPDIASPDKWNTENAAPMVWPDTSWWTHFNSPTLTAQIEEAQKANDDLKAAVARVRQADAQVRIAGASLLPSVEADGGVSRERTPGGRVSSTGLSSTPKINNSYNGTVSAAYELDFWGKNYASAESARQLAEASRYDQQVVILTVLSSVADTYFDILAAQERLKIARENLANAERLLESIRQRFQLGVAAGLDVAQQESVVAARRAIIPPLELQLRQSIDAQAILLGKMPDAMTLPTETLADMALPDVAAGLPSELLARRPDVQRAEAQLASAHADIVAARAAFFPSIQLTAQGGYASSALANLLKPDSILWAVAGSLTQPIFEGGRLEGQLELQKARHDELLQNYHKAVIAAFSDAEDALAGVQQTAEGERAQEISEQTAQRAYDLSQEQFKGGVADITSVLDTQRTLFTAQELHSLARQAHLKAIVGLYKALGGGWKQEQLARK